MRHRFIKKKIPIRLSNMGILLFAACIGWMAHPPKATAALLDLLPDISVNTPVVSVDISSVDADTPLIPVQTSVIGVPPVKIEIPAVNVEVPVVKVEMPAVKVELPPVKVEAGLVQVETPVVDISLPKSGEAPEKPATGREEKEPSAAVAILKPKPADVTKPKPPAASPVKIVPDVTITIRKPINKHHKQHIIVHQQMTPTAIKTAKSVPIPAEPLHPRPANSNFTAILTGGGSTSGGGLSAGAGSAAYTGGAGLVVPIFLLHPPNNVKLYYERSHLYGANQWCKPPPVEPPRYTLLLR